MNSVKSDIVDLKLELLPEFAAYILSNRREEFVRRLLELSYAADLPLLRYLVSMSEEEIFRASLDSNTRLLTSLQNRNPHEYIETTTRNWVTNQLPLVSRDQIIVEDITLINYLRKKTFREVLRDYSKDPGTILKIVEEIDRFTMTLDSILFKTYISIQQEQLHQANEKLQKREQELLEAQSIGNIGSFEWDLTGQHRSSYTPEVFKIFEMEGASNLESFIQDVHPDDRLKLRTAIEKAMHDGLYECQYRYIRNKKLKILHSRGKVYFDKTNPVKMVGTVTDVTEKEKLILRLKESEDLSKQAQALTKTGNWKWSIDNDTIEWSDEMYRIYGLEPQCEKITFERFLSFIHEDDRNRRMGEIADALKSGHSADYIMRIVSNDGKEKVLKGRGEVILDKNHLSKGMLGTCQDITNEHKLTEELKRKNEELLRKNRDLESFNFIASHDLQEPLRKIQLYSNRILAEGAHEIPGQLLRYFNRISSASGRMQKMIADFLMFYHAMSAKETIEGFDLNLIIEEITHEMKEVIENKKARIIFEKLPEISGVRLHIHQMLKHLISNALKFSKKNEPPEIRIRSSFENSNEGKTYVRLSIADNGIGFDPKYTDRIFELFQRLHNDEEYSGSGIGLSLCKKIAEDHHGWIAVTSEEEKGSEFCVYLPVKK